MQLNGKVFLVTGGGSGLGEATAKELAAAGSRIVIADVDRDGGERVAGELGDAARFIATDVTDEADVRAAVDLARDAFGGLHGAICCAGVVFGGRVLNREGEPHALDAFQRTVNINLVGTFNVVRLVAQAMADNEPDAEGERGVIVNAASVAAFDGQIGQAAYSASKAAIAGMTLPLARDLSSIGVRVMAIAPGIFETAMMASLPEKVRDSLGQQTPFPPRLGRPEEFSALVRHIAENVMLNGETIRLDGAIRMAAK